MHFSKTYQQLLLTLPPDLQENAIEYRQLKKLINKLVGELTSLGLSPSVLHTLLQPDETASFTGNGGGVTVRGKGKQREVGERFAELIADAEETSTSGDFGRDVCAPALPTSPTPEPEPRSLSTFPRTKRTKAVYEVVQDGEHIHPRLRIQVGQTDSGESVISRIDGTGDDFSRSLESDAQDAMGSDEEDDLHEENLMLVAKPIVAQPGQSLIWTLQRNESTTGVEGEELSGLEPGDVSSDLDALTHRVHSVQLMRKHFHISEDGTRELIIPLQSDMAFFELLYSALQTLASHLSVVRSNFIANLASLARTISDTARPQSALPSGFHAWSSTSDPKAVTTPLISPFSTAFVPGGKSKSDLYTWREIFQLYAEAEVFESMHELDRGERPIGEAERRLALFAEQVTARGLNDKRKLEFKESREALETFLKLNVFILNLKKFQFANAEAARKILKKHAKRTALPFPIPDLDTTSSSSTTLHVNSRVFSILHTEHSGDARNNILTLIPTSSTSLPRVLIQAIGETLLPIIPHLDDYSCMICYNIAFKPIRLDCGHLFCVRCLIKMQKRSQDHCPCCRAPVVLKADRSNVDWAMLNFLQDWFPREAAEKLKQNEMETAKEQMEELGLPDRGCIVA